MQAARYYGSQDVRVDDVEPPSPDAGEVVIDVESCGICGSDLHQYLHGSPFDDTDHVPYTMGHELSGTVTEVGEGVDLDVGTAVVLNPLVACGDCWCCDEGTYNLCRNLEVIGAQRRGGYAEQVAAPAENVLPLPDGLSTDLAAVAEPVAVAYHALMESPFRSGQSVCVVGLGPIGLGLVQLARDAGAGPIFASGHREARRDLAHESGADVVIDPRETDPAERVREETEAGVDVAFEVAGRESAFNDAIKATRANGCTTLVGVFEGKSDVDPMDFVDHERTVNASAAYQTGPLADRDFGPVLDKFAAGTVDAELLVTSRVDLDDIVAGGFEALAGGESEEVKVLVKP